MKDVSMMPMFIPSAHIGVYPDGSPVVYDPEKAAAKRAELAEKLRDKQNIELGKPLFISYTPELERGFVRSPEKDTVELSEAKNQPKMYMLEQPMMMAKMSPVEVIGWIEVIDKGAKVLKPIIVDIIDYFDNKNNKPNVEEPSENSPSFEEVA